MTTVKADGNDLEFDFKGCPEEDVIDLDKQPELVDGTRCDFVVFPPAVPDLLIEVKDPCQPDATPENQKKFLRDMKTQPDNPWESRMLRKVDRTAVFVQSKWTEKNEFLFLVVLGLECLIEDKLFDGSVVGPMQDNLLRRIKAHPTLGASVTKVRLLSISSWNKVFPQYPLRRISTLEAA